MLLEVTKIAFQLNGFTLPETIFAPMPTTGIQQEIICYLPDKDEPIILPASMEDFVRGKYMGHPQAYKVRIEPVLPAPKAVKATPAPAEEKIFKPTKKMGRPKKVAVT